MKKLVVVRGAGDIASGVIQKLHRCGFKVVALEVENPSFIRRKVCYGEAVYEQKVELEGDIARLARGIDDSLNIVNKGDIAVLIDPRGDKIDELKPIAIIDAILAKKNLGTNKKMAPITLALGPGFEAGRDVDAIIETMRGHDLGRIIYKGSAVENTGIPGIIKGYGIERVVYSSTNGKIKNIKEIGDIVKKGEPIASIDGELVVASIDGVLRGLIRDGYMVKKGLKIADIDPRIEEQKNCYTISDKARSIGGAVVEALMVLQRR